MPDQQQKPDNQQESSFTNEELIRRYNTLQRIKPHFTVPKIKLAFSRNMTRIQSALEPFRKAESDLREQYGVPESEPLFTQDGGQREEIDSDLYDTRDEYLSGKADPYDPYTVPESLLDNEAGQMSDGRVGLPDGAVSGVLWMFEEEE